LDFLQMEQAIAAGDLTNLYQVGLKLPVIENIDGNEAARIWDHPVAHQPWRWGSTSTNRCEDVLDAPWRIEAQRIINRAVESVGGHALDITWFLGTLVVTLDHSNLFAGVDVFDTAKPIQVTGVFPNKIDYDGRNNFVNPQNTDPDDVWHDQDDYLSNNRKLADATGDYDNIHDDEDLNAEKNTMPPSPHKPKERKAIKMNYSPYNEDYDNFNPDEDIKTAEDEEEIKMHRVVPPSKEVDEYGNEVMQIGSSNYDDEDEDEQQDPLEKFMEQGMSELERSANNFKGTPLPPGAFDVNQYRGALSTIAHAIMEELKLVEEDLQILERHEIILTGPGKPHVLETQRQFDAFVGHEVLVETRDPFESNRTLQGKLVDRNTMDVIINKEGRMVTIPYAFVHRVKLPPSAKPKNPLKGNKKPKKKRAPPVPATE
jgi:ribosome maturation factor RimP